MFNNFVTRVCASVQSTVESTVRYFRNCSPYTVCCSLLLLPPVVKISSILTAVSIYYMTPIILVSINSYLSILSSIGCINRSTYEGFTSYMINVSGVCIMSLLNFSFVGFVEKK